MEIKKLSTKKMISLEGQTEIKQRTREKEKQEEIRSGQHKEGTVHVSNKGSLAVDKSRDVSPCVWVWSERTAVPSGSGAANPIC